MIYFDDILNEACDNMNLDVDDNRQIVVKEITGVGYYLVQIIAGTVGGIVGYSLSMKIGKAINKATYKKYLDYYCEKHDIPNIYDMKKKSYKINKAGDTTDKKAGSFYEEFGGSTLCVMTIDDKPQFSYSKFAGGSDIRIAFQNSKLVKHKLFYLLSIVMLDGVQYGSNELQKLLADIQIEYNKNKSK